MKSIWTKQVFASLTAISLVVLPTIVVATEGGLNLRHRILQGTTSKFIEHDDNPIEGEYIVVLTDDTRGSPDDVLDDIVNDAGSGASRFTHAWSFGSRRGSSTRFRGGGVKMGRDQVSFYFL